jgi:hypothetical protein
MSDVQLVKVAGTNALAELDRLRGKYPSTGLYPILLGDLDDHCRILETPNATTDISATLAESRNIDPARWFREKPDADPDLYQPEDGEWPTSPPEELGIITHQDVVTRKPKSEVLIGLLKVAAPWEVFAHLNWGGWNDCPFPAEHCAIHRYWTSLYGAEVVSVTGDVVQCVATRPPRDRDTSLRLAREQYVYCYDIVEQGVQSIAALAAGLLGSAYWYFWWD